MQFGAPLVIMAEVVIPATTLVLSQSAIINLFFVIPLRIRMRIHQLYVDGACTVFNSRKSFHQLKRHFSFGRGGTDIQRPV